MIDPPKKLPCELCQQPVLVKHFVLATGKGDKYFCCEGCKSIYQLLNPSLPLVVP